MRRFAIALSVCCALSLVLTPSAIAAPRGPNSGTLTVNTLFDATLDSPVVEATGVFTGCTSVTDVESDIGSLGGLLCTAAPSRSTVTTEQSPSPTPQPPTRC